MPVPQILLNFHLQDILGNVNLGSVIFTLIYPPGIINPGGIARVPGTAIVVNFVQEVFSDVNGFCSINIWGNDLLTPGPNGSFYALTFKDDAGSTICTIPYQFTGAGTQDLSNLAPFTGAPSIIPAPANAVVTNPLGQQTIIGFPLSASFIGQFIGSLGKNTVASGPTPQFDLSLGSLQKHTLNQNIAPTFVSLTESQPIWMAWTQDGVGGRTIAFPANMKDAEQPDPTIGRTSVQRFITIGTNLVADGGLTPII